MIPQAIQVFRYQYVMEFIGGKEYRTENSVKAALIKQMKQFILELGKDCTISASEQFGVVAKRQINGADLKLLFKFASLIQK